MAITVAPSSSPTTIDRSLGLAKNLRERFKVTIKAGDLKKDLPAFIIRLPHRMPIFSITLLSGSIVAAAVKFGLMDTTTGVVWLPSAFKTQDLSAATTSPLELYLPAATYPSTVTVKDFMTKSLLEIMNMLVANSTFTGFPAEVKPRLDLDIATFEYGLCLTVGADVATAVELIFDIQFAGI